MYGGDIAWYIARPLWMMVFYILFQRRVFALPQCDEVGLFTFLDVYRRGQLSVSGLIR